MSRVLPEPSIHSEDRNNPSWANFALNRPVEKRFVISQRLFDQRPLDREGRAICRIVYPRESIEKIARISCVSEETVRRAIQNRPRSGEPDEIEDDYNFVDSEYMRQYPPSNSRRGVQITEKLTSSKSSSKPTIQREKSVIDLTEDTPPPSNRLKTASPPATGKPTMSRRTNGNATKNIPQLVKTKKASAAVVSSTPLPIIKSEEANSLAATSFSPSTVSPVSMVVGNRWLSENVLTINHMLSGHTD